jgi:glycosyltransferase involved in cell wall biosynthesis
MKILVQVGNLGSSLIERVIRPIAGVKGVKKIVVISRRPGPRISRVEYHSPPRLISKLAPLAVICEFFTLLYLSITKRPGFILGYLLFPHGLMAFIIAKLTRRPVIISLIAGPVELYAVGSPLGIDFTKPLPRLRRILLKVLKHADAVVTTGSFTKSFLISRGVEESKIYPLTGVNPPSDSRVQPRELPKLYDIISVARLAPVKHLEVLLRATSIAREKYKNIRVCIVGDGPCRGELEALANELGLNDNVNFAGFQRDVAYYYNSARIFVLTSEREGSPTAFLEAVICGLPGVVSNCGDITDVAQDGFNSLVIQKYDDHEGFAQAIIQLLEDKELYHKLARNALETAETLSMEKVTQAWESLLDRLGIRG